MPGGRDDSYRSPGFDSREPNYSAASFDDRYHRSPPRYGEGLIKGSRRQASPQCDASQNRPEVGGGASPEAGYVHPDCMPFVSLVAEPTRDSRPQGRNKNGRPSATDDSRAQPIAENKKTVLTAEDSHQWTKNGNENVGGRGSGRGRGGNQRGGRGRDRGVAGADRYVPPPLSSWSDSQFDEVYRRR
jgi:hypothetical protein